jgi:hypothetical protein
MQTLRLQLPLSPLNRVRPIRVGTRGRLSGIQTAWRYRVMDCMPFKYPNEQEIDTVVENVTSLKGTE